MPERTCVCCRKKSEKENLIRLSEIENKYVFDEKMVANEAVKDFFKN